MVEEDRRITAPKPARRRRDVAGFGPTGHHPAEAIIARWEAPAAPPETEEPIELVVDLVAAETATALDVFVPPDQLEEQVVDVRIILPGEG